MPAKAGGAATGAAVGATVASGRNLKVEFTKDTEGPFYVSYYRTGDKPSGGELNGVYKTREQADQAVQQIKKWAADIDKSNQEYGIPPGKGTWAIQGISVEGSGMPAARPDTGRAASGRTDVDLSSVPRQLIPRAEPERSVTAAPASALLPPPEKPAGKPVLPALNATTDVVKNSAEFRGNAPQGSLRTLERVAKQRIAQDYVNGPMTRATQRQAVVSTRAVGRSTAARAAEFGRVAKGASGVGFLFDAAEVVEKVREAPPEERVETAVRATTAKVFGKAAQAKVTAALMVACVPTVATGPGFAACIVGSTLAGAGAGMATEAMVEYMLKPH